MTPIPIQLFKTGSLGTKSETELAPAPIPTNLTRRASEAVVNETTKAGFRRAIHAAWDKLPETLTAAVVALVVFGFGLWIDGRDMRLDLDHVMAEQQSVRFCERVSTCPCVAGAASALADCKQTIALSREHIESHNREAEQWKQRIIRIEQQLFEMSRHQ